MRHFAWVPCLLMAASCGGHVFDVKSSASTNLPGIPFVPLEIVETTTVVDTEAWTEIKVTRMIRPPSKAEGRKVAPATDENLEAKPFVRYVLSDECVQAVQDRLSIAASPDDGWTEIKGLLGLEGNYITEAGCSLGVVKLSPPTPVDFTTCDLPKGRIPVMQRVSLTRTIHAEPAFGRMYYINVDRAAAGTSSGTFKLNDKGMLTDATGSVESKTLETILNALPVKEAVSSLLGLPSTKAAEAAKEKPILVKLKLDVVPVTRAYKRRRDFVAVNAVDLNKDPNKDRYAELCWNAPDVAYEVGEIKSSAKKEEATKDDEKDPVTKIGITGQMTVKAPPAQPAKGDSDGSAKK